jgi:tRNA(Ile)-lysidine synthetase-like protein
MCDEVPIGKDLYFTLKLKNINGNLVARSKKDGDTIRHGKMTKKVKKILSEKKIPSHTRDKIPLICDNDGIVAISEVLVRDGSSGKYGDIIIRFYK